MALIYNSLGSFMNTIFIVQISIIKHPNNWSIRENWDAMKALRRSFLWSNFKEHVNLGKAFSF